jgi:ATP-dependent RNA helicase MSS116
MDDPFTHAVHRRMTALFQSKQDEAQAPAASKFDTKNRSKELKRLSLAMKLTVPQLKEALTTQRTKLDSNSEKAEYVDWLLTKEEKRKGSFEKEDAAPARKLQRVRPTKPTRAPNGMEEPVVDLKTVNANAIQDSSLLSKVAFADQKNVHPLTAKAISQVLGLEYMTEIQSKTFGPAQEGKDVLGRARTGTGKTIAFLLPAVERLLSTGGQQGRNGDGIGVLIISPTRELASQIGVQAEKLLSFHKGKHVQVMYGGTKMGRDVNALNKKLPFILVATPGRLMDHLENTQLNGVSFGRDIMKQTPILVLDETDRLLDMGFRREITKIMGYLPRQEKRQTLLFSATVPKELKKIMAENMRKDFVEVDCISDGGNADVNGDGGAQHTNKMVKQSYVVLPSLDRYVVSVVEIVTSMISDTTQHNKLVVFFPTARLVGYFAEFFNLGLGLEVIELHSRKSQSYRNNASDKFRQAKSGILFTSDVSARGVDYPDVTGVIQVSVFYCYEEVNHLLFTHYKALFKFSLVYPRIGSNIFIAWEGQGEPEKPDLDYWFWHHSNLNLSRN